MEVVENPIANANNTNNPSDAVDMQGYRCVSFVVPITDSSNNGKAELRIEGSDESGSGFERLSMPEVSATAAANDGLNGKILRAEVKYPLKRYLRSRLITTSGNVAFGPTIAISGMSRREPVVDDGDVLSEQVVASPGAHS